MKRVGLFIPCYVDQLYPQVGVTVLELLKRFDVVVEFPVAQTCCGQPMANTGCDNEAQPLAEKFLQVFQDYDHVVCPSGSCVAMVRHHYDGYLSGRPGFDQLKAKTFEVCEYLTDVLEIKTVHGKFPHRVGLHQSCHGLRELGLASSSEMVTQSFSKVQNLLQGLTGIELVELSRTDECCGFGGTFAVNEEAVSCMMGNDRIRDHVDAGAEVLTGVDMSCLMHLEGLIRRQKKSLRVMHVAEILIAGERAGR